MCFVTCLAVSGLEGLGDLQALDDAATGEDIDDGLLVSAEALHGLPQGGGIGLRIKGLSRVHRGGALRGRNNTTLMFGQKKKLFLHDFDRTRSTKHDGYC